MLGPRDDLILAIDESLVLGEVVAKLINEGIEGEVLVLIQIKELPFEAQASSLNSLQVIDFNKDGNLDIVAGGNLFSSEVETPRNDACFGWLFEGDGNGN